MAVSVDLRGLVPPVPDLTEPKAQRERPPRDVAGASSRSRLNSQRTGPQRPPCPASTETPRLAPKHEPPNALMAISEELRRLDALAARRPLDPDDTEVNELIVNARDALGELADALEARVP